jgi:mitochondrial ATPase complex subunit ATP10
MVRNNTPVEQHDTTLICLRKDLEDFRDALRIHNVMCGYVFLLDGIGRVRFAGSGEASEEEANRLIQFARDLTTMSKGRLVTGRSQNDTTKRKAKKRIAQ